MDPAHRWQFPLEEETQGRAAGVRDAVGQDRAWLRLAMARLIAEINGILKGSEHESHQLANWQRTCRTPTGFAGLAW